MIKLPRIFITALCAAIAFGLLTVACHSPQAVPYQADFDELTVSPNEWQERGQTFRFSDQTIFYMDEGSGPAILFLHGYPTSSWDFHKIWDDLSAEHRLIAPDNLGYGFSDKPSEHDYSISDQADMLIALLTELGVTESGVVAHDVGVNLAQELMARSQEDSLPFAITSLVLLNGTLFDAERNPTRTQDLLVGPMGSLINNMASEQTMVQNLDAISGPNADPVEFAAHWYLFNYPDSARLAHRLLHTIDDRKQNETRWANALCVAEIPIHLMIGVDDPTSGIRLQDSLLAFCDDKRTFAVTLFEDVGHFPQLEADTKFVEALRQWLAGA